MAAVGRRQEPELVGEPERPQLAGEGERPDAPDAAVVPARRDVEADAAAPQPRRLLADEQQVAHVRFTLQSVYQVSKVYR